MDHTWQNKNRIFPVQGSIGRSFGAIAVAIFLGFPLFPFAVIGGFTVQLVLSWTKYEHVVERLTVNDITGLTLDLLIAAAIGTLSLNLGREHPEHPGPHRALHRVERDRSAVAVSRFFSAHWFDRGIAD